MSGSSFLQGLSKREEPGCDKCHSRMASAEEEDSCLEQFGDSLIPETLLVCKAPQDHLLGLYSLIPRALHDSRPVWRKTDCDAGRRRVIFWSSPKCCWFILNPANLPKNRWKSSTVHEWFGSNRFADRGYIKTLSPTTLPLGAPWSQESVVKEHMDVLPDAVSVARDMPFVSCSKSGATLVVNARHAVFVDLENFPVVASASLSVTMGFHLLIHDVASASHWPFAFGFHLLVGASHDDGESRLSKTNMRGIVFPAAAAVLGRYGRRR